MPNPQEGEDSKSPGFWSWQGASEAPSGTCWTDLKHGGALRRMAGDAPGRVSGDERGDELRVGAKGGEDDECKKGGVRLDIGDQE